MVRVTSTFSLVLLTGFFCILLAASPDLLFDAGNRAYLDGDYGEALDKWHDIEDQNYESGELYYNIGNAYFKQNELGYAILYWEKAQQLLGDDEDVKTNLEIARARLADKIDEQVRLPIWDWFDNMRSQLSTRMLTIFAGVLSFVIFTLVGLNRWVLRNRAAKSATAKFAWVFVVLFAFNIFLVGLRAYEDRSNIYGVMLVREAEVLSAPAEGTGKLLFTLHEGTKVRVKRSLKNWHEISAGKDKQGWVKSNQLGII